MGSHTRSGVRRKSGTRIQIVNADFTVQMDCLTIGYTMFLKDSQVSILPKYTSNDLGGESHKYVSNQIGGKRKSKKSRKSKRKTQKRSHKHNKSNKNQK